MDKKIIKVIGLDGTIKNVSSDEKKVELPSCYFYLQIENEGLNGIEYNDIEYCESDYFYQTEQDTFITMKFDKNYESKLTVWYDHEPYDYRFRINENLLPNKTTILAYNDFGSKLKYLLKDPCNSDDIVGMVNNGSLPLLRLLEPETEIKQESLIRHIEEKLFFAFNICHRPRIHLRKDSVLQDVSRVKNINSFTIRHLASNSEHWQGRTLSGVVPSRLMSEVFEDDYDIYENIFFRMAMEKMSEYITNEKRKLLKAAKQSKDLIDWSNYQDQFVFNRANQMISKLFSDYDFESIQLKEMAYQDILQMLDKIERKITTIQWSTNYKKINPYKKLELPIKPTNILNMDRNYHEIFRLWNRMIKDNHIEELKSYDGTEISSIHEDYFSFIVILTVYAINSMGFQINDSVVSVSDDRRTSLSLYLENDKFFITAHDKKLKTGHDVITIKFTEKLNKALRLHEENLTLNLERFANFIEVKDGILVVIRKPNDGEKKELNNIYKEEMKVATKDKNVLSKKDRNWRVFVSENIDRLPEARTHEIVLIPTMVEFSDEENEFVKMAAYHMMLNIVGDSVFHLSPYELSQKSLFELNKNIDRLIDYGENSNNHGNYAPYSRGLLPISQIEVNSISRIMKIIEMTSLRLTLEWEKAVGRCPSCGSKDIHVVPGEYGGECRSDSCKLIWGKTRCHESCGKEFVWTRPEVHKKSREFKAMTYYDQKLAKESWFGNATITEFDLNFDAEYVQITPRCPICGVD